MLLGYKEQRLQDKIGYGRAEQSRLLLLIEVRQRLAI